MKRRRVASVVYEYEEKHRCKSTEGCRCCVFLVINRKRRRGRQNAAATPVKKINRSHTHTHTPTENNTPDTDTHAHDKNNTPNPQTNTYHKHLTTLEGGATTVRATSHTHPASPMVKEEKQITHTNTRQEQHHTTHDKNNTTI